MSKSDELKKARIGAAAQAEQISLQAEATSASRVGTIPPFDTSKPGLSFLTASEQAVMNVAPETLVALFKRLDGADEALGDTGESYRAAGLNALQAVIDFTAANPLNGNGRFSRTLELLYTELKNRPISRGKRMLPDAGGGAGGVNSRPSELHIKAAAVFAAEFLREHGDAPTLNDAYMDVADILSAHGFSLGAKRKTGGTVIKTLQRRREGFLDGQSPTLHAKGKATLGGHSGIKPNDHTSVADVRRAGKGEAVKAWRRECTTPSNPDKSPPAYAEYYEVYRANPPVAATGNKAIDAAALRKWLLALLARASYGSVA